MIVGSMGMAAFYPVQSNESQVINIMKQMLTTYIDPNEIYIAKMASVKMNRASADLKKKKYHIHQKSETGSRPVGPVPTVLAE